VRAAVEDLPKEFDGVADEIHIISLGAASFEPWQTGDSTVLAALTKNCCA
jgi:hypothetical protein